MSDFLVPDLGEGLEEATVSSWCVAVGDTVELNQPLCTLETAKAEVEIPSPYAGRVSELGGEVGAVLPVGSVLVRIETAVEGTPNVNGVQRNPVLVGYGTDATADASRRHRPRAKPAVRKLAAELGVQAASLYKHYPTKDQVLDAITASVTHARNYTDDVEWSAEDATRTEFEFLCRCVETAIK